MTLAEAIVKQQPHLAGDPLIALLEANPEQTELLLPVLVLSTLQYNELKRMPPSGVPHAQVATPRWVDDVSRYQENVGQMGELAAFNKYVLDRFGWK